MDPLSITLAVVTLATAVKDMVELGQKIHESFSKVSKNLRNAQHVAKDIKEMVENIRVFYENHKDALDNMENFRVALLGLLDKFRSFEASIIPLLPKTGGKRLAPFLRGWWNNNIIEGRILDLQRDIVKVILEYTMSGVMRNEVKLERVHQDANRGFADVQQGITQGLEVLDVVRRDVSVIAATMPHRLYESSGTASDEFDRNVIMFAQSTASTSVPMLRTPNVITEELMTAAYIKLQINSIAMTVEKLKMLKLPASSQNIAAPDSVNPFQLVPILNQESMSITRLRHHVIRQVTGLRDLLEIESIYTISVDDGAVALNELSFGLRALGMHQESILVGEWAITLSRTLVDASGGGQPDLCASMALYLLNQSVQYYHSGDTINSLPPIQEAYTVTQTAESYAELVDHHRSIEMCMEAVQVLEDVLNVRAYTQSNLPEQVQIVVHHGSSFVDTLFSSARPTTTITSYATALYKLGTYLSVNGHSKSALDLQLLAIAVRSKLASMHGHEHNAGLAWALSQVVQGGNSNHIPAEKLVNMADECILLLRDLAEKNPLYYARQLLDILQAKADTLESLNRDAEAIAMWEEVASLAGQIIQDSRLQVQALDKLSNHFRRLNRHADAVRTTTLSIKKYHRASKTQARRYRYLSRDLRQLQCYKESVEAAQTSVTLYRHLAIRDPDRWMGNVTQGLSSLACLLAASGNYPEALMAWKESVDMLDSILTSNLDASSDDIYWYLDALNMHRFISFAFEDKEQRLKVCSTAVQYLRQLSEIYPQNADIILALVGAEFTYAYTMLCVGCLQDVQQYLNNWLGEWSSKPPDAIPQSDIRRWHALMIHLKADVLDAQGCTEQALLTTQEIHDIVRPSISTYQLAFDAMIESMIQEALLLGDLGTSEEALQIAEKALQLSRDNKPEPLVRNLMSSLYGVSSTALSCQNYTRAAEAAQEGCDMLARPKGLEIGQHNEYNSLIRPSLLAILSSAEANCGRCSTALEFAHMAVKGSLDMRDRKAEISATTAEQLYMETRGNLANILLNTSDFALARQVCEERKAYFSKRVEQRMGEYRELAPILRMLGILCCSEGRHEEGEAEAKELSRLIKTLGAAFPSLQEQVKIRLRRQAKVPILKVLDDMCQKLDCKHQTEVASLFEI